MTFQNAVVVRIFFSSSIAGSDAVSRLPTSGLCPVGVAVVLGSAYSPVSDAASPLSLAGVLPWGVAVVFGFLYVSTSLPRGFPRFSMLFGVGEGALN